MESNNMDTLHQTTTNNSNNIAQTEPITYNDVDSREQTSVRCGVMNSPVSYDNHSRNVNNTNAPQEPPVQEQTESTMKSYSNIEENHNTMETIDKTVVDRGNESDMDHSISVDTASQIVESGALDDSIESDTSLIIDIPPSESQQNNTENIPPHHQIAEAENDNNANMERELNTVPDNNQSAATVSHRENRMPDSDETSSHDISANKSQDSNVSHDTNVNWSPDASVNESHNTNMNESCDSNLNESQDTNVSHDTSKEVGQAVSAKMDTAESQQSQGKHVFDEMVYKIKLEPQDYEENEEQYEIKDDDEEYTLKPKAKKKPRKSTPYKALNYIGSADKAEFKKYHKSAAPNPKLLIPFDHGWQREVVRRNNNTTLAEDGTVKKTTMADTYYYTPKGFKLRSMVQIDRYLTEFPEDGVNIDCFSFCRYPIYKEPFEKVRNAGTGKASKGQSIFTPPRIKKKKEPKLSPALSPPPKKIKIDKKPIQAVQGVRIATPKGEQVTKKETIFIEVKGSTPVGTKSHIYQKNSIKLTTSQNLCTLKCPGLNGVAPSLHCGVCMCLFHPECVNFCGTSRPALFVCLRCKSGLSRGDKIPSPNQFVVGAMTMSPKGWSKETLDSFKEQAYSDSMDLKITDVVSEAQEPTELTKDKSLPRLLKAPVMNTGLPPLQPAPVTSPTSTTPVGAPPPPLQHMPSSPPLEMCPPLYEERRPQLAIRSGTPRQPYGERRVQTAIRSGGPRTTPLVARGPPPLFRSQLFSAPSSTASLIKTIRPISTASVSIGQPAVQTKIVASNVPGENWLNHVATGVAKSPLDTTSPTYSQSRGQVLTLPPSVLSKINLNQPLALKLNGQSLLLHPSSFVYSSTGVKILLPANTVPQSNTTAKITTTASGSNYANIPRSILTSSTSILPSNAAVHSAPPVSNITAILPVGNQLALGIPTTVDTAAADRLKTLAACVNQKAPSMTTGHSTTAAANLTVMTTSSASGQQTSIIPDPGSIDNSAFHFADNTQTVIPHRHKKVVIKSPVKPPCHIERLHMGFVCLMLIFKKLNAGDLLRASRVCRTWRNVIMLNSFWKNIKLEGTRVSDWESAACFFKEFNTKSLDMRGLVHTDRNRTWHQLMSSLGDMTTLRHVNFGQVPAGILHTASEKLTQLESLVATQITDKDDGPDMLTTLTKLDIGKFSKLTELKLLHIRGLCGLTLPAFSFSGGLSELASLKKLKVLSITTLKDIPCHEFEFLEKMESLEVLEIGDCTTWSPQIYESLGNLYNLSVLSLEKGIVDSDELAIELLVKALLSLSKLSRLELIQFPVTDVLSSVLTSMRKLQNLYLWPSYHNTNVSDVNAVVVATIKQMSFLKGLDCVLQSADRDQSGVILIDEGMCLLSIDQLKCTLQMKLVDTKCNVTCLNGPEDGRSVAVYKANRTIF